MARYSIAEAKDRLPALINAAQTGEEVIITRRGEPVAVLNPVQPLKSSVADTLERLRQFRQAMPDGAMSSAELIRRMRDEDEGF